MEIRNALDQRIIPVAREITQGSSQRVFELQDRKDLIFKVLKDGAFLTQIYKIQKITEEVAPEALASFYSIVLNAFSDTQALHFPDRWAIEPVTIDCEKTIGFYQTYYPDIRNDKRHEHNLPFSEDTALRFADPFFERNNGELIFGDWDNVVGAAIESIGGDIHNRTDEVLKTIAEWGKNQPRITPTLIQSVTPKSTQEEPTGRFSKLLRMFGI